MIRSVAGTKGRVTTADTRAEESRVDQGRTGPQLQRIESLDTLRGLAVLGILLMNIQAFSMPVAAYLNPSAYGSLEGVDGWIWLLSHLLADRKFLGIFSIVFGAGIVLLCDRVEAQGQPSRGVHYRRMFWLLLFGAAHAYLLWYGDILFSYALCGMLVYPFRRLKPRVLLGWGLAIVSVASALWLLAGLSMPHWPEASRAELVGEMWSPSAERTAREVAAYRGGWLEQMKERVPIALEVQTSLFLIYEVWRVSGMMLVGMALYRWGVLTARRSTRFYLAWLLGGAGIGIPLTLYGVHLNQSAGWSVDYSLFFGRQINYWASIPVAMAWISLVMLAHRGLPSAHVVRPLTAVGRMAFTNYILQTLICTTVFYGHGWGRFGTVGRLGQLALVLGIWLLQLTLSPLWLRSFRFGPLEWVWRSLTYGKWQPMRARRPVV